MDFAPNTNRTIIKQITIKLWLLCIYICNIIEQYLIPWLINPIHTGGEVVLRPLKKCLKEDKVTLGKRETLPLHSTLMNHFWLRDAAIMGNAGRESCWATAIKKMIFLLYSIPGCWLSPLNLPPQKWQFLRKPCFSVP